MNIQQIFTYGSLTILIASALLLAFAWYTSRKNDVNPEKIYKSLEKQERPFHDR